MTLVTLNRLPKIAVIEDFLPSALLAGLLDFTLKNSGSFHPTEIIRQSESHVDFGYRNSLQCSEGLAGHKPAFKAAIHARQGELLAILGIPPFDLAQTELQLIAHGDGAFYKPHIDTHTGADHAFEDNYRVLSCVYYFYREPKKFTGGEIAIFPFGESGDAKLIEPLQNRLVAFPSFALHEVRAVSCPDGEFADSRFSINCWLRKAKVRGSASPSGKAQ